MCRLPLDDLCLQAHALRLPGVLDGGNLVYCAPTSGGKSLVRGCAQGLPIHAPSQWHQWSRRPPLHIRLHTPSHEASVMPGWRLVLTLQVSEVLMLRRVLGSKDVFNVARPALLVLPLVALCEEKAAHLERVRDCAPLSIL